MILRLLLGLAFALLCGPVQAALVYNNTATYLNLENALLPAGQINSPEHGNEVTLGGVERSVTNMVIMLRIYGAAPALFDFRVRFYRNDGPDGRPGTLLWESPLNHRVIDSGGPSGFPLAVPNVLVPDTFIWTIQVSNRSGNMALMGPSEYNPPVIGSAPFGFWRRSDGPETWEFVGLDEAPFGARIVADPAPAALDERLATAPAPNIAVRPNPVMERAEFVLAPVESPGAPLAIEIYDLAGRLVDRLDARSPVVAWAPPPGTARGMYFARIGGHGARTTTAFVLLR